MEYRNLGRSGLQVSVVGLGCNNFGRRCDPEQTAAVVSKAIDAGINLFDTADVYGGDGKSEEYLGKALVGRRHDVVIATKFGMKMGEGPYTSRGSRRYIINAVEASLRRLGTDYIDLYQMHAPDPTTPIDETLRALDDCVRQGKVRYVGNSNYAGWQTVEAALTSQGNHLEPFISAQNEYSLLDRRVENELVPACKKYGLGILPYFPLASGFLTGKYRRGEPMPAGTRLAAAGPMAERIMTDRNWDIVEKLDAFAVAHGHTILELAFCWLASKPEIGSVIAGATQPAQVEANAKAGEWRLTAEEMAEVDTITRETRR
jgi:aryl-alcohol dehydrogenase-like predicted oxidoreductase